MKHTFILTAILVALCCSGLYAQQYETMAYLNQYPIVNHPGATLAQIEDTLNVYANPTDTGEGGAMDQLMIFKKMWGERVNINDTSGQNMFQRYTSAVSAAITSRLSSGGCGGGGFTGAWKQAGPDSMKNQTSGYCWKVWAGSGADSNIIITGSWEGGGVFKTVNGGASWTNISDSINI